MFGLTPEGALVGLTIGKVGEALSVIDAAIGRLQKSLKALDAQEQDFGEVKVSSLQDARNIRNDRMRINNALGVLLETREHVKRGMQAATGQQSFSDYRLMRKEHGEGLPLVPLGSEKPFMAGDVDPLDKSAKLFGGRRIREVRKLGFPREVLETE
jgi:hypothetical protein